MSEIPASLSTSALAKALGKTTKQMFAELESLGWIERLNENWGLTNKGEFEGGRYRESHKFGRYIIWPGGVVGHKALASPDANLMTSHLLGKQLSILPSVIDKLLQEMGWTQPGRKGWLITSAGELAGGYQRENPETGVPYILWSERLLEDTILRDWAADLQTGLEGDALNCCDGHNVSCEAERKIDNWLYMSGIVHAYHRRIPDTELLYADFYLPQYHLYIEYWGEGNAKDGLSSKMKKKEKLQALNVRLIELKDSDVFNLEDVLPRLLLKYNIET
jgi:hypothetical protein